MTGLPALKNRSRALAGRLLVMALAVAGAVAAPVAAAPLAHAAPAASARPLAAAAPSSMRHPILVQGRAGGTPTPGGNITFSAVGATPKGPNGRYAFVYVGLQPGTTVKDWVELYNRSPQSDGFTVYGVDATGTALHGGLIFDQANQKATDIGSWTGFVTNNSGTIGQQGVFVIGGHSGIIEPFTITVPQTAAPGDHTGGIIVQVGHLATNSKGEQVTVYDRIVLPVELRVAGPLTARLQVQSVSTSFNDPVNPFGTGSASISYTIENLGNTRLGANDVLKVSGLFGTTTLNALHVPVVLPGDEIRITQPVSGLYPLGLYTAHVTVTPTWPPSSPSASLQLKTVSAAGSFFAVPWAVIVVILLLVGLGYGTYRFLRWRARERVAVMTAVAAQARKQAQRAMEAKGAAASSGSATASSAGSASSAAGASSAARTASSGTSTTAAGTTTVDPGPATASGDPSPDGQGDAG